MGEGPGGLEGKGCRRYHQALKWRKERAASGCARPAACLGCRTLTVHGASNGPEVGSRAGPTWGSSSVCSAGSGSRLWGSEPCRGRTVLSHPAAVQEAPGERTRAPGAGPPPGRGTWPSALSADALAKGGGVGRGRALRPPCHLHVSLTSSETLASPPPASAKPCLGGPVPGKE